MSDHNYKVIKHDSTKREIQVTIPYEKFAEVKDKEIKHMGKNVKLPGFRPGKAPKEMIEAALGNSLIEHSLEHLLSDITYDIIEEEKLSPVSRVKYDLKEMAIGKDIEYTATFHNFPEFKLPDFKKLDVKMEKIEVTEEEINGVLENFYRDIEKLKKEDKVDLTKIDDKWVEARNLSEAKTVVKLRELMKETIEQQKQYGVEDKLLTDLIEKALEKTKIDVPDEFIDGEVKMKELQDKKKIEDLGLKWEDWMRQQKTDMETLTKKWKEDSEKLYQRDFLIIAVANQHNLTVKPEEVEAMLKLYGGSSMSGDQLENLRMQLTNDLTRRKALEWILKEFKGTNNDKK